MTATASLERAAFQIRRKFLRMHFRAQAGHIGTGLSCIDILTYVYGGWLKPEDVFILSKGHGASSLYATLHHFEQLSDAELKTYYQEGTLLPAHPASLGHPAIPVATGSLGHGLPISNGLAFARLVLSKSRGRVACLLSDGECNEGAVWEAALFAAHHRLKNLVAVVDANGLQGFGRTSEVLDLEPLVGKWKAFGWEVRDVNGHSFAELDSAFAMQSSRPLAIIARTIKGKGVSFLEDRLESHYWPINESQLSQALRELDQAEQRLVGRK